MKGRYFFTLLFLGPLSLLALIVLGIDGLIGDFNLKKLSLAEIEANGIGDILDSRYIEISGCFTDGTYLYGYEEPHSEKVSRVIFPVINRETFLRIKARKMAPDSIGKSSTDTTIGKITTHILVQRNEARFKPDCAAGIGSCTQDLIDLTIGGDELKGFTLRGLTLGALTDSEGNKKLKSLNYTVADNVVFLEEDTEPRGIFKSVMMIIGGILGIPVLIWLLRQD